MMGERQKKKVPQRIPKTGQVAYERGVIACINHLHKKFSNNNNGLVLERSLNQHQIA